MFCYCTCIHFCAKGAGYFISKSGGLQNRGNTRAWAPRIYAVCLTLSNFQSPLQNLNVQRQSIRGILVSSPEEWSGWTRKGEQMRRILFIQKIKGKELRKLSAARKRLPASITALCYSSVLSGALDANRDLPSEEQARGEHVPDKKEKRQVSNAGQSSSFLTSGQRVCRSKTYAMRQVYTDPGGP